MEAAASSDGPLLAVAPAPVAVEQFTPTDAYASESAAASAGSAAPEVEANRQPHQARLRHTFATSFAFCFGMREGMLLLVGLQALSALFWLYSLWRMYDETWPSMDYLRVISILLLLLNASLGMVAISRRSERCALGLVATFGLLVVILAVDFGFGHPSACSSEEVVDGTPLGQLLTHLLWTADACLLMSILGWVSGAGSAGLGIYLWYMCVCYWVLLRRRNENVHRVRRAIASLPCRKYAKAAVEDGGEEGDEHGTCAICLGDFEEGEEVRLLPCMHEFCKPCIDQWIERQGLSASCPLCKRLLVPGVPGRNERQEEHASIRARTDARAASVDGGDGDGEEPTAGEVLLAYVDAGDGDGEESTAGEELLASHAGAPSAIEGGSHATEVAAASLTEDGDVAGTIPSPTPQSQMEEAAYAVDANSDVDAAPRNGCGAA
mmetsp:Transcript_7215/g.18836  ORF Transcript_7215/g.18836 Transcript_7215/m.18836 type:complete len:437 (+) Transcript_7215:55-1365(+)|eukprot:CAMPEP_0115863842 /NCGR_PEP_ID=MMETSP0287-20121206/18893_1 /TAXON_ID=412157 /ORGANISM="Chrysochromulina rotalis, Strain UIO044" /LENGTH=436 /DNA_ID=CAMNT_0003318293 /DNA_START=35 /DNA_END=1345 /DNA_ORIENTATION=+